VHDHLTSVGELKRNEITTWLNERRGVAKALGEESTTSDEFENLLSGKPPSSGKPGPLHRGLESIAHTYGYNSLAIFDRQGALVLTTSPQQRHQRLRQEVVNTLTDGRQRLVDLHEHTPDTGPEVSMGILQPIIHNGATLGILWLEIEPGEYLYPMLSTWPTPSQTAETLLARRDGNHVVWLSPLRHSPEPPLQLRMPLTNRNIPAVAAVLGVRGIIEDGIDYLDTPVLAYVTDIPTTSWHIVSKIDRSEALQQLEQMGLLSGGLIVALLLGITGTAVFWWRQVAALRNLETQEKERIHHDLQRSETRWQFAIDGSGDGLWDWNIGTGEVYFSDRWKTMLGFEEGDIPDTLASWEKLVHPDDAPQVMRDIQAHLDGRTDYYTNEHRMRCKDGSYKWILDRGKVVEASADGKPLRMIGTHSDLTDKKLTEQVLIQSEREARAALNELRQQKFALDQHAIVAITDIQGNITYANDKFCDISGYAREDLLGQNHRILNSGIHPQSFFKQMYRTIARGQVWQGEICNRARQGHLYWVGTTIVPFLGADGKPQAYIAIRTDITERKLTESELEIHRVHLEEMVAQRTSEAIQAKLAAERANQAKSMFLANMSHELRTPMHAILSFGKMGMKKAEEPGTGTEKLRQYFDRIVQSGDRLLLLLNDLLDLSKLEAGKMVLHTGQHLIADLVRETLHEVGVLAENKGITLDTTGIPNTLVAEYDAPRMGQVLRNLLSNAIKFSPQQSTIHLSAEPVQLQGRRAEDAARPGLKFEVCDAGVGIPDDELKSIFEKFMQSSKTRTGAGGTGLGLAICHEIVEAHQGRIYAVNRPEGGACLIFEIPLRQHEKGVAR